MVKLGVKGSGKIGGQRGQDSGSTTPEENLQNFGLLAPSALRAVGSVESANRAIRSKVNISLSTLDGATPDGIRQQLDYTYNISGVDLGLQHASSLHLSVSGSCYTEYGWIVPDANVNDTEVYVLYPELGNDNRTLSQRRILVTHSLADIKNAPRASFITHPLAKDQLAQNSNVSFAVLIASAHRASISKSSDPWYTTETRPTNDSSLPPAPYNATEWMKLRRPVLSCFEQDLWRYDDPDSPPASSVLAVDKLPDINLPDAIHKVLLNAFSVPMVVTLGNAIGDSALRSRTTSPRGVIDAAKSSIKSDMERLIMAAYIASVNVFSGTVSFTSGTGGYPNVLEGEDGEPAPGAADIVVNSSDVQTFSMAGLISLAAILGFLCIQAWVISWLVHEHSRTVVKFRAAGSSDEGNGKTKKKKSVLERFSALEAPRLFNDAFEVGTEARECKEPTGLERTVSFVRCGSHNCPGHVVVGSGCDVEAAIVPPFTPHVATGDGPDRIVAGPIVTDAELKRDPAAGTTPGNTSDGR